ncbi:MAG: response regulator [Flavobacterium sp.]|nr:MAG: response regulator [Flavobacterium sp.]
MMFSFTNWYEVVSLPIANMNEKPKSTTLDPFNNAKILLAEDNPINTFLILKILKSWNIEVDVVENGEDAIAKLQEQHYDLILMDTYMPIMNGLDAIKLIRSGVVPERQNIPIINFSAAVMESDEKIAIDAGANDILNKSFDHQLLHDKLSQFLSK